MLRYAPNGLTILRVLLIPVLVVVLVADLPSRDLLAATAFVVAALTDALDGYLARSRNVVTDFGAYLDPIADKLLVGSALGALILLDRLPIWVGILIVGRELAVTALRVCATRKGLKIVANRFGKLKTVLQVVMVTVLLCIQQRSVALSLLITLTVAVTIASGLSYFVQFIGWSKRQRAYVS